MAQLKTEEDSLLVRYARTGDPLLRERLIHMHERLVRYLAGKFASRGEPLEDLVQVGTIGLINAIDRYDPSRGIKFTTFATPTIVGEIQRYFRDKAWKLKVPRRLQELNASAARARDEFIQRVGRAPTVHEVAVAVGATEEETLAAIELSNAYDTVSLDAGVVGSDDFSLADYIGVEDPDLNALVGFADLKQAMEHLEPRERAIINLYYGREMSQSEIAVRLHISQMHVSRLQKAALKRLRKIMDDAAAGRVATATRSRSS
ncbi:MAG: SigB/SigF/SigG family RNA polymerase sigma factor [Capsulimonadaceae bacterium]